MSFIVIEGLDGSGKSTQIKKFQDFFSSNNIIYKYLHFPRTDSIVFGDLVARFLRGEFGALNEVNPYLVALIYAGDRENAKQLIERWLDKNILVLVDRYVYSNIAFQCAKLKERDEKDKLKKWILSLEFDYYKIPKPDLSLFLDVPQSFTTAKLNTARSGSDRDYLKGKSDIHENSIDFQGKVRKEYLDLMNLDEKFIKIDCTDNNGSIKAPSLIFSQIIDKLKSFNFI